MKTFSNSEAAKRPVIFISYSHDNKGHSERVVRLATRLREAGGCDCRIDRDAEAQVTSWPRWMRKQIKAADVVLIVFTRNYRRRFDGDEVQGRGLGATWEGTIIENSLYAAAAGSALLKFVPIVLHAVDANQVPRDVFSGTIYRLPVDWDRLVRRLHPQRRAIVHRTSRSPASENVEPPPIVGNADSALSVLFVGAERGTGLNLRGQLAQTRAAIARARFGKSFALRGLFNLTPEQLLMELNDRCPDVLHLSGRQERGQMKMHDSRGQLTPVSAERFAALLGQYPTLRLVILDTCGSLPQARQIVKAVDASIGVAAAIAEPVATDFFALFFNALASGSSIRSAYRLAFGLQLAKIDGDSKYRREVEAILETKFDPKKHLPSLVARRGVNLDRICLAGTIPFAR